MLAKISLQFDLSKGRNWKARIKEKSNWMLVRKQPSQAKRDQFWRHPI